jgi:hypothetical protein
VCHWTVGYAENQFSQRAKEINFPSASGGNY